ncbi:MAG TPA: selenide, water dikinase SelD, partial [Dehalococcoidia bacterium]|nr:selenide, water dikinase SelD [Dehalococcoidia bacterium]
IAVKGGAKPGDALLLTKPLGAGVTITGRRMGMVDEKGLAEATSWMTMLNSRAANLLVDAGVRTLTDVTGFGLVGHALEMSEAAGVRFVFEGGRLPLLPIAIEMAKEDVRTSGDARNRRSAGQRLTLHPEAPTHLDILVHDPQTSGGLLAAAAPEVAQQLMAEAEKQEIPLWRVGEVVEGSGVEVRP